MARVRPSAAFTLSLTLSHLREEFLVVLRLRHLSQQEFDRLRLGPVGQELPQQNYSIHLGLSEKQFFFTRTGAEDVDRRINATISNLAIKHQFHVAGALELLEDH